MLARISHHVREGRGFTGCGKTLQGCHPDPALREKDLALRIFLKNAQGQILRCAQNDSFKAFFRSLFSPAVSGPSQVSF